MSTLHEARRAPVSARRMPARSARPTPRRRTPLAPALVLACIAAACGPSAPLAYTPLPVAIGHDATEVLDIAVLDLEGDGVLELVAARLDGLHLLRREDGRWQDATPGTGLDRIAPVEALATEGLDLLVTREGRTLRLRASGIGTWTEAPEAAVAPAQPGPGSEQALHADADLDGDGALDRARVDDRIVRVLLRDMTGRLHDVTTAVASDALPLHGPGRRVLAADLDGDGDVDLVVVGGRILVLLSNGGTVAAGVRA